MGENSIKYEKELHYVEKGAGQPVIFIHGTLTDLQYGNFSWKNLHKNIMLSHIVDDMLTQTNGLGMVTTT